MAWEKLPACGFLIVPRASRIWAVSRVLGYGKLGWEMLLVGLMSKKRLLALWSPSHLNYLTHYALGLLGVSDSLAAGAVCGIILQVRQRP